MNRSDAKLADAVDSYSRQHDLEVDFHHPLGIGQDGIVWPTSRNTAIKAFYRERNFRNERNCYFRLLDTGTTEVAGFAVPSFERYDNDLLLIELGVVTPPRVLDFGKAYLDTVPDFDQESINEHMLNYSENYDPDDWERVLEVVAFLKTIGIHYYDLRPGKIQVR